MKLDPVKVESGYVNREELASILGFSSRHISNLMKKGILPYIKIGKSARFRVPESRSALNKYKIESTWNQ
jgi:uncharacterized membrane protein